MAPPMNPVSLLGLLALLGLAWLLSYHKRKVRLRPVVWGLGLQFTLALIILRADILSYVGMVMLGLLLVSYMLRDESDESGKGWKRTAAVIPIALAAGFVLTLLPAPADLYLLLALVAFLLVRGWVNLPASLQRYGGALVVVLGVAILVSRQIPGRQIFEVHATTAGERDGTLHGVLQLAHVARPLVA